MRLWLTLIIILLASADAVAGRYIDSMPSRSVVYDGFSRREVEERLSQLPAIDAEGLWQMTSDGAIVAIERWQPEDLPDDGTLSLRMVVVSAPNRSLRPGTLMGYIAPTAAPGVYDARIYTSLSDNGHLSAPRTFRLQSKDDALTLHRVRSGLSISWFKLFPYLLRRAFNYTPDDRNGIDGLVRLRPPVPRYL